MTNSPHIVFHAGFHKTGTTSIQTFLDRKRDVLLARGVDFYAGLYQRSNHVEIHAAAMRFDRPSGFKQRSGLLINDAFRTNISAHVYQFILRSPGRRIVFSNEGLSLLRYPDEMDCLRRMVPAGRIEIVLYTRNVADFTKSYSLQLQKNPRTLPDVVDKESFAYLAPDSWVLDFENRINGFRNAFGSENVTVLDYDQELNAHGNVIPSFLQIIGIEPTFGQDEWKTLFLNRSPESPRPRDD